MSGMKRIILSAPIVGSFALLAASAAAQPAGLSKQAPASTGSSEVAKEGFQAVEKQPEESKDSQSAKVTAGAFFTAGNSRTLAVTGVADYRVRRGLNQFSALAAANYGESAPDADSDRKRSVQNFQGRLRYDYFFADSLAGFLSVSGRNDRFQGLDLRLNIDPGLAYYFVDDAKQLLWAELGYDLQHDIRREEFIDAAAADDTVDDLDKTETRHSARAFVGYENRLSETVNFSTSLEYIQSLAETENMRLNFDAALASKLNEDLSISVTYATKYDNNPLPDVETTDIITAVNLVYALD